MTGKIFREYDQFAVMGNDAVNCCISKYCIADGFVFARSLLYTAGY